MKRKVVTVKKGQKIAVCLILTVLAVVLISGAVYLTISIIHRDDQSKATATLEDAILIERLYNTHVDTPYFI